MRLSFFTRDQHPEQEPEGTQPVGSAEAKPPGGKAFPADEVAWGIVIRNGFDEMDDPWYHRGTTQHAYLEGNDNVAICGFRPPQSGPRSRRRSRLGMPTPGEHPMCGSCARLVVAPRPRVPVPVQGSRPPVAVPVARPAAPPAPPASPKTPPVAIPIAQPAAVPAGAAADAVPATSAQPAPEAQAVSPWVAQRTGAEDPDEPVTTELGKNHDGGLLERGIHTEIVD